MVMVPRAGILRRVEAVLNRSSRQIGVQSAV